MNILIVGLFSPLIGGVAKHCDTLKTCLSIRFQNVSVLDVIKVSRMGYILKLLQFIFKNNDKKLIHFHHNVTWHGFVIIAIHIFTKIKIVITIHDLMQLSKISVSKKILFKLPLSRIEWIGVNNDISNLLISYGVNASRINVIPAFLPDTSLIVLPDELKDSAIVEKKKILFYANSFLMDNRDVYGINTLLDVVRELNTFRNDLIFIVIIPQLLSIDESNHFFNRLSENNIHNIILYNRSFENLNAILDLIDVYFRPTITDGDSVLIREALYNNCKVCASNVVERPPECFLFDLNDLAQIVSVLESALDDDFLIVNETPDYFSKIYQIYKNENFSDIS